MSVVRVVLLLTMIVATPVVATNITIVPTNMLTAETTTKPGCPRTCGTITIPYPFGVKGCNMNNDYEILCNTSHNPPRPILYTKSIRGSIYYPTYEVVKITETQLMVKPVVGSKCYNSEGKVVSDKPMKMYIGTLYTVSAARNQLVLVGGDDTALFVSSNTVVSGCYSTLQLGRMQYGSGENGCCLSPLPSGLTRVHVRLSKGTPDYYMKHYNNSLSHKSRCSYAFLAGDESYDCYGGPQDFGGEGDDQLVKKVSDRVFVVVDWIVVDPFYLNCTEAQKNDTTYACQSNTQCVDTENGFHFGYRCECLSGYEGNPYIGCTDVDECRRGLKSSCSMICLNTPGSYKCSCPTGYYGDGLKSGIGCTKISSLQNNGSNTKLALGLGVSLGSILLLLFGWWFSIVIKRRRVIKQKAKNFKRNGGLLLQQKMSSNEEVMQRIKIFNDYELEKATDHFNKDRILGQGGQGTVYKGMLGEGKIVAIKKSKIVEESHIGDFINEVAILSQINHRNIVKLIGCCLETEVPLLVYEYISNGTLFQHIHYPSEEFQITWKIRLQIASDSAGALAYLHSSSSIPIFHRDIKSSNILLDNHYRAKLSDFGTSRSVAIDQTHVTTRVMGTFGYLDPEYFLSSQFTEKSDVYSFGVVLVELLTGQKAIRTSKQGTGSLTVWFIYHMDNSLLMDVIDSQIIQDGTYEEFLKVAILAKRCLNSDGKNRPTMKEVQSEIEVVMSHHLPKTTEENRPKSKQPLVLETNSSYNGFPNTRTFLENSSSSSAEVSLLFNPR